jgi:hypothetical protein
MSLPFFTQLLLQMVSKLLGLVGGIQEPMAILLPAGSTHPENENPVKGNQNRPQYVEEDVVLFGARPQVFSGKDMLEQLQKFQSKNQASRDNILK